MTYVRRLLRCPWQVECRLVLNEPVAAACSAARRLGRGYGTSAEPTGKYDGHFVYTYEPQMDVFWSDLVTDVHAAMPASLRLSDGGSAGRQAKRLTHAEALALHNARLQRNHSLYLCGQRDGRKLHALQARTRSGPCSRRVAAPACGRHIGAMPAD